MDPHAIPSVQKGNVIVMADSGWGDAQIQDIAAVLSSAREQLLRDTSLDLPSVLVVHGANVPLMHRDLDGSNVKVTLTSVGRRWCQFAFQFGHEMCHAVAWHTRNGDGYAWAGSVENSWLEESFCEASSYLVLERMAETWRVSPPYDNWKEYADQLKTYLQDHKNEITSSRPADFRTWFNHEETSLRSDPLQRQKNQIIAERLLPYMQKSSSALTAISKIRKFKQVDGMSLTQFFKPWHANSTAEEGAIIITIASEFGCLLD